MQGMTPSLNAQLVVIALAEIALLVLLALALP
jgi:hypothetical protein